MAGTARVVELDSERLRNNPWGDPTRRRVVVYTPPSGKTDGIPLLLHLTGFMGAGWIELPPRTAVGETLIQTLDRMIRSGDCPEVVLVAPDALTALGGSQYVNSSATGPYADYVAKEILPWARREFGTGPTGVLGQSSGGFGALHLACEFPGLFDAVGSSAGDAAFEYCYLPDFPRAFRELRRAGGAEAFLARFFEGPPALRGPTEPFAATINTLAMAACYSPRPDEPGAFDLPFDPETGAVDPEVWRRWLAFDPVRRVATEEGRAAFRRPRLLQVTGSETDEWFLDVGARMFAKEAALGHVPVVHEEFAGGHFDRTPRFEALFRRMATTLARSPSEPRSGAGA